MMKLFSLLLLLAVIPCITAEYKAVLVAGSNGWINYRHQADVFHAYSELINNNIDPNDIILFAYNDIAYNVLNPYPGVVINEPNGSNIFPGNTSIDYSGDNVTPENFLSVLRNLSDPNLDLLIYFADHGGPGILCFPNEYLHVSDLKEVILSMNYSSLFFIVEACESGSIFDGWFPDNTSALALTASNFILPSFACYLDPELGTYLGDCFSVNTLQFLGHADTYIETIDLLAKVVKNETNTSPVSMYGDVDLLTSIIAKYWGKQLGGVQEKFPAIPTKHSSLSPTISWNVPREVGIMTNNTEILKEDVYNRVLYNQLDYLIQIEAKINLDRYTAPVKYECIKSGLNIILNRGIKLSEYSHRIAETIAILCDKVSEPEAQKIIYIASQNYFKWYT